MESPIGKMIPVTATKMDMVRDGRSRDKSVVRPPEFDGIE